jgi:hypothetical protein
MVIVPDRRMLLPRPSDWQAVAAPSALRCLVWRFLKLNQNLRGRAPGESTSLPVSACILLKATTSTKAAHSAAHDPPSSPAGHRPPGGRRQLRV